MRAREKAASSHGGALSGPLFLPTRKNVAAGLWLRHGTGDGLLQLPARLPVSVPAAWEIRQSTYQDDTSLSFQRTGVSSRVLEEFLIVCVGNRLRVSSATTEALMAPRPLVMLPPRWCLQSAPSPVP